MDTLLDDIYYDPSHPAAYAGIRKLQAAANQYYLKVSMKQIKA
jgi:hypothetical protein